MCTAISFHGESFFFGRTLDHFCSYGEEVIFTPRNFPLPFRNVTALSRHHAILGMAHVAGGYPLYYDAMNEHGLCMAGLNFPDFARYGGAGRDKIASFELIPWILGRCDSVSHARVLLSLLSVTAEAFSPELPATALHWILADRNECITIESMEHGLMIWENPVGVLTNSPPFDDQLRRLADHMHLSARPPHNLMAEGIDLRPYTIGMGAMGLPGDLSSQSRFVRAAFMKLNAEKGGVSRFFRILDTVRQVKGCSRIENGSTEYTRYSSCCDCENGIYYYTTDDCCAISGVDMKRLDMNGSALSGFPLRDREDILLQN